MTELKNRYGKRTAQIVRDLLDGRNVKQIAAKRKLPVTTVRTTVANYTRGIYDSVIS